ncbi:TIGR03086 family metal-binding protein [Nocardia sp. NPDC024068]|uniref:TIGR03086 family metal-binding protein n=1 Tax=Nocardia sp. NPDC024068 TaxID=3157197 RepID=UPI0034063051
MSPDPLADLERASRAVVDLITAVRPDQWAAPTPCTEWSVRDLVDHLVGSNLMFLAIFGERPMPERGTDILGDDPLAAYTASASALEAAFARPGILEETYQGPLGEATGVDRLQFRVTDLLAHGWDLSRALGVPDRLPEDLAEAALAFSRTQLPDGSSRPGRFAAAQPVPAGATAVERLVAFLGRPVSPPWTAPQGVRNGR